MRPDGTFAPNIPPRLTRETALAHPTFLFSVMQLWDRGLDTKDISLVLFETEGVCAFCVQLGREQRMEAAG